MKRILSLILAVAFMLGSLVGMTSCFEDMTQPIRIGYMAGPTGMGMAKLIHDNGGIEGNDKYKFTKYADTKLAKADLAAGKIDIICLPTNEAAAYYNSDESENPIKVLAVNCLNSLYLLSDSSVEIKSFEELQGKTIYTCKNGTPRMILEYIVEASDVDANVSYVYDNKEIATPADLGALIVAGKLPIAAVPEPIVTSSLLSIQKAGNPEISYSVDIDLSAPWGQINDTPITMGCVVAQSSFIAKNAAKVELFLDEYKASIDYIGNTDNINSAAEYVVETEVMNAAPAAKKALMNLGDAISYLDGDEMKEAMSAFFEALEIKLPDSDFYYEN